MGKEEKGGNIQGQTVELGLFSGDVSTRGGKQSDGVLRFAWVSFTETLTHTSSFVHHTHTHAEQLNRQS